MRITQQICDACGNPHPNILELGNVRRFGHETEGCVDVCGQCAATKNLLCILNEAETRQRAHDVKVAAAIRQTKPATD